MGLIQAFQNFRKAPTGKKEKRRGSEQSIDLFVYVKITTETAISILLKDSETQTKKLSRIFSFKTMASPTGFEPVLPA